MQGAEEDPTWFPGEDLFWETRWPAVPRAGAEATWLPLDATLAAMADDRIEALRSRIDEINDRLLHLIAERQEVSLAIAAIKAEQGMALYSHEREAQLLERFRQDAVAHGLDPDYVEELMNVVLRHSRAAQRKSVEDIDG